MLGRLAANIDLSDTTSPLITGTGKSDVYVLVVVTSDRGLCGGFNNFVVRAARQKIRDLHAEGKEVKIVCVGRKGRDALKRDFGALIVHTFESLGKKRLAFADAQQVTTFILDMLERGEYDVCSVVYNQFKSVISQVPVTQQLVPLASVKPVLEAVAEETPASKALYIFEPSEHDILDDLLPRNLAIQVFRALLDSAAGEQAARMTAMENATKNAGDMINKLTLRYNRARQAYITKELIEIISGAEAV
jgi:F-type H+-transporting ATPase subunit gamma